MIQALRPEFYSFILGALFMALLTACGTVSPDNIIPDGPSANHSGVYAHSINPDGSIKTQWWYASTRNDYNALIAKYGSRFLIPLKPDDHLTHDGIYWKADINARYNLIEMREYARRDNLP